MGVLPKTWQNLFSLSLIFSSGTFLVYEGGVVPELTFDGNLTIGTYFLPVMVFVGPVVLHPPALQAISFAVKVPADA
jgi:hypothetical protein